MRPKFGNPSIFMREVIITSNLQGLDQKKLFFFDGWSWFKFNNLGMALGVTLKFYISVSKGLKLQVRKFRELKSYVCRRYSEKIGRGGGTFWPAAPHPE